jgi:RNA polymerase sigma-70 factor, ECF subfamily
MDPSEEPTDADLVARVRNGDLHAYGALVRRHQRSVWRVAVAMLGDQPTTESLVQQCFVTAFERLHQYDVSLPLDIWLKAIVRNLVRMEVRREGRQSRLFERYREHLMTELGADDDAVAVRTDPSLLEAVAACRRRLSEPAARALQLRYDEGRSLEDVADALERTVVATRQLLFRTRVALRACVEKKTVLS